MYCPLRGSHSNQLCITSHTKKSRLPHPHSSLILKNLHRAWILPLSSSHHHYSFNSLRATAAAALPPQNKKKSYTEMYFGLYSIVWMVYLWHNRLCDDIFSQKTFSHSTYFDWKHHPIPPTSKLLPDSHTKIFLSPNLLLRPFSVLILLRFLLLCCCCCHHLHHSTSKNVFNQPSNHPNQPSYLQMLFVLYEIIRIIARCRLFSFFYIYILLMLLQCDNRDFCIGCCSFIEKINKSIILYTSSSIIVKPPHTHMKLNQLLLKILLLVLKHLHARSQFSVYFPTT